MRAAIALALLTVAGCSTAPSSEPDAAEPTPRAAVAAKRSDAMSRVDQIAAEAARREAEYQQSLEDAKKPKSEVPVVTEFSPQASAVPAYASGGTAPRPEKAWWDAQMNPLRQAWAENDAVFAEANGRLRATGTGPDKNGARKQAMDDQQRASQNANRIRAQVMQLQERARQMQIPEAWVKWP
jgi:hypothetical protein